jgi:hypothetical protein|tara:strand:+ start:1144 stop:1323 length:180 start_codon:yes stop_codon:yes gene_type:complete
MIDYECMYRALVRRLVEIADVVMEIEADACALDIEEILIDFVRVARAHEPNIKEEDDVS